MTPALKARFFVALQLLLLLSIVLTVLLPYSPANGPLPSRDSGVFLYTGWRVLQGELPYRDIWDHKAPVVYYLDALGLALVPASSWGVWMVEAVSLWIAAALAYFLLKRLFDRLTAIFLSFLWLLTAYYLFAGGNLTTEYALPFQFAILWLFYRAESAPRFGWRGFFIGVLTALLFFTRQNAVAIPLALGIYLVFNRIFGLNTKRLRENLLPIVAGGLATTGIVIGYFAAQGALAVFWDQVITYNLVYTDAVTNSERFSALMSGMNQLANVGLTQLALAGWGIALMLLLFRRGRFQAAPRALLWVVVISLPLELWLVSLSGRPRLPYFLTLLPVFTICAALLMHLAFDRLLAELPRFATAVLMVGSVTGLWLASYSDMAELAQAVDNFQAQELISYIQTNTAPEDAVLMWGAETAYNYAARRRSPTRFVYQYPLYRADYANKENVTAFLNDLIEDKPRLIIMESSEKLSDFRFGFRDYQIGGLVEHLKGFYIQSDQVGDWVIYTYNGQ